jgi:hypothetical protein
MLFSHIIRYSLFPSLFKKVKASRHQWLMPVILATWEAEIRRIAV